MTLQEIKSLLRPATRSHSTIMKFHLDDGGRFAAGFTGRAKDCAVRAVAIATRLDYAYVHAELMAGHAKVLSGRMCASKRNRQKRGVSPDNGTTLNVLHAFMKRHGWTWKATMGIGTGCRVHLLSGELPAGRLVVRVSKHVCAVIDGVLHDTFDCTRDGTRCVYGYWHKTS